MLILGLTLAGIGLLGMGFATVNHEFSTVSGAVWLVGFPVMIIGLILVFI